MVIELPKYERMENDAYYTPLWVTEALFESWSFPIYSCCWEPANGEGHISMVLDHKFGWCFKSDITSGHDFLLSDRLPDDNITHIITNPPFGVKGDLAVRFVEHALKLTKQNSSSVIMLLISSFRCAKSRRHIFCQHPAFAAEITLLDGVSWENLPDTASPGPWNQMSWFVWDWSKPSYMKPYILDYAKEKK